MDLRVLLLSTMLLACVGIAHAQEQDAPDSEFPSLAELDSIYRNLPVPPLDPKQFVNTVARQPSSVGASPAAVFVVTNEMIRRSGARSIPEALRMVPGLHVARVDGSVWSISSRGFSSRIARKLLVQIDGRTVYTTLFGGTYWDVQDLLLEDIDRIEVIRGPGATIWGVNAVNGIINIITKDANATHGVYTEAGGGSEDRSFGGVRIGNVTENGIHWRVFGKAFDRDRQFEPAGRQFDDWQQVRLGFRTDWYSDNDLHATVQGDLYTGENGHGFDKPPFPLTAPPELVDGGDLLARVTKRVSEDSEWSLQTYYDRTERLSLTFDQLTTTWDIDFQHRFRPLEYHRTIWGVGYRRVWDNLPVVGTPAPFAAVPVSRETEIASFFVQDEFEMVDDRWFMTLGAKLTDDSFTDFQVQPSLRFLFLPNEDTSVWWAVSRAVRIPSRLAHDGQLVVSEVPPPGSGIPLTVFGNPGLNAEETIAYEMGIRRQPADNFNWDLALFYNVDRDGINSGTIPTGLQFFNGQSSEAYGVELAATWEVQEDWRILAWYSFLRKDVTIDPRAVFTAEEIARGNPRNLAYLMSSWDLTDDLDFDLIGRYVDNIQSIGIPHYFELDVRLAWRPQPGWELSVVGQNLLDAHHPEYNQNAFIGEVPTEIQRSVYGMVSWRY